MGEQKNLPVVDALRSEALDLLGERREEDALTLYRRIADHDPENVQAWRDVGVSLAWLGRRDEAVAAFMREDALLARKLERCPGDGATWQHRAVVLFRLWRTEEALTALERSCACNPKDCYWLLKGDILASCDRHEEAIAAYRRALARFPGYNEVWPLLGNSMYALGRLDEAIAWYALDEKLVCAAESLNGKGAALYAQGRFDEALAAFAGALNVPCGHIHSRMWHNLGIVMQALQRHEDAETAFLWAKEWESDQQNHEDCRGILLLNPVIALDEGEGRGV